VLPPFASKYYVSFEPYFLVSMSANILDWHSFFFFAIFGAGLGGCSASNVTCLLLFTIWWSQGVLQVP